MLKPLVNNAKTLKIKFQQREVKLKCSKLEGR